MKREDTITRKQRKRLQLIKKIDKAVAREEKKEENFQDAMRKIFSYESFNQARS